MAKTKVLVTSIGGDLGKAVCKSLRYSPYDIEILGTDCKNYIPYPLFCDTFHVIPRAGSEAFLEALTKFVTLNSFELIYICSEQELLYICDNFKAIPSEVYSRLVILPLNIINICRDKYKTVQFLKENNFPYPSSMLYDKSVPLTMLLKDIYFPFVIKKTSDCGSKHIHIINNMDQLNMLIDLDNSYMLQEYILGTEYTNAVYRDAFSGETYVITLERTLKDGMSSEVKVVFNEEIEKLCKEVAIKLNLTGSINIQLRKAQEGPPTIFEINPRYSSTAFMRARFGFNDVIFAFENMALKKAIAPPRIRVGEAYRYVTEYYKFY